MRLVVVGLHPHEREKKERKQHLKKGRGEDMCACVCGWMPTCSGADKLQNQGPAGDNTRSTGQKVPERRQNSVLKPRQCKH